MANPERVLTPVQLEALRLFGTLRDSGEFYLSGAAALSGFYLEHRRSNDLDLFTANEAAIDPAAREYESALRQAGFEVQVVRRYRTFCELSAARQDGATKLQLVVDSPYRLEVGSLRYENVAIDSLRDLAANKLLAAFGRAEPRDLVDVYVLVRDGRATFDDLVRWARDKDPGLDAYYLAQSLRMVANLPERADQLPVDVVTPVDLPEMKRTLLDYARHLLEKGLPT